MKEQNVMGMQKSMNTTENTNPLKMSIEYAKPSESKDSCLKQENLKTYMTKINSNDNQNQIHEEIDPVDLADLNNPQYVAIYVKEIFEHLRNEEVIY